MKTKSAGERVAKTVVGAAALLGSLFLLSKCTESGPEQSNSYVAIGRVDRIGDESIHLTDITAVEANGSAVSRLNDGEDIHDNYDDFNCVGHETSDDFDRLKSSGELVVGATVRVEATVGAAYRDCIKPGRGFRQDRSLLESLEVLPG